MEESHSNKAAEAVIETLTNRGWCLGDIDQVKAIIIIQTALSDDGETSTVADSVESELLNMDLRSIGAKSLPDPNLLNKTSHLKGPKVLQISSVRDISVSSIEDFSDSGNRRLLKLVLTDGHNEITAIEYSPIPSIPNDVVPGTKVRLENKAMIHSRIICLNPKVITLIGGVVQSLYDEWKLNQKYSGTLRSSLRLSQESDYGGPPPFEKLQVGVPSNRSSWRGRRSDYFESTSTSRVHIDAETARKTKVLQLDTQQEADNTDDKVKIASFKENIKENPLNYELRPKEDYSESTSKSSVPDAAETDGNTKLSAINVLQKADGIYDNGKTAVLAENIEQNPINPDTRPKEVVESVPVQNQAAAQKLLQKMNLPKQGDRQFKGRKHRGKGKQEEPQVFTLDEWQKRNIGAKSSMRNELPDVSYDEDLAWKLQNQLDLEDSHVQRSRHNPVADDIRMSMFNYERDANRVHGGEYEGRGRGRGKGKGRGSGRGAWKGKGRERGTYS